jgi:glutamate-1-semialdehyde 2,1-aminomutase
MNNRSKELFEEAKKVIPGGVDSPVRAFSSVGGTPPFMKSGKGAYITDEDDNSYLDFVQSWGPLIFGHCDNDIEQSVIKAVKNGLSFGAPTKVETLLANEITDMFDNIDKVRFVSSGTEAVMSAIRLARGVTNRNDIIKFTGCYHGHSDSLLVQAGSGAATFGTPSSPGVPSDFTKHTILCQYNNIEQLKECFDESSEIACVIIEPIAGNMGLVPANDDFLVELRRLCDDYGVLLIFDEVMSGFRASLKGASGLIKDRLNIEPDIVTFGKVIGAGMPVGAFCASNKIMNQLSPDGPIYQAGTLSGNPVAMHAGLTSLTKLKNDTTIYDRLEAKAKRLTDGFKEEASKHNIPLQTGYIGSMFGFFFCQDLPNNFEEVGKCDFTRFAKFHQMMLQRGFYFACSQYETGFISDAMSDEDIENTIKNAGEVFSQI